MAPALAPALALWLPAAAQVDARPPTSWVTIPLPHFQQRPPTASTIDKHVHLIMPSLVPVALSADVTAPEHVEMIMAVHAGTPSWKVTSRR
jgi:hypothetical protein